MAPWKRTHRLTLLALALASLVIMPVAQAMLTPNPAMAAEDQPMLAPLVEDLTGFVDESTLLPANAIPVPAAATGIGPGSKLIITRSDGTFGCTANFVWRDGAGRLYLGAAGHCFMPADKRATHGPGADFNANGVSVRVCVSGCSFGGQTGFVITGTMVALGNVAYARQSDSSGTGIGNDFGIVDIPTSLHPQVRTELPVWGAWSDSTTIGAGSVLCHYGISVGFGETFPTMARTGVGLSRDLARGAWYASLAATFGDSGSGVITCGVDATGIVGQRAAGILTHGVPGYVAGTSIARAITMASEAGIAIALA